MHALKNNNSNSSRAAIQITVPPGNHSGISGEIRIICFDIRNQQYELSNQVTAMIKVWAEDSKQKMIKRLNGIAQDSYDQDIFGNYDLQLSMESSEADAQIVANAIIKKCEQVLAILPML